MPIQHILKVAKIFETVSGEGIPTGKYSTFLRLSGCDFDCSFCDTDYKHKYGIMVSDSDRIFMNLIDSIKKTKHLVITGGEPLLQIDSLNVFIQKVLNISNTIEVNIQTHGFSKNLKKLALFYKMLNRHKEQVVLTVSPKLDKFMDITNYGDFYTVSIEQIRYFTGTKELKLIGTKWWDNMSGVIRFLKRFHTIAELQYSFQYEWVNDTKFNNKKELKKWIELTYKKLASLNRRGVKAQMSFQLHKLLGLE